MVAQWGCGGLILWMWWLNDSAPDCKSAVLGSNPASLQPAGTCQFLVGESQQGVGMITAGWPLKGGRGKKVQKCPQKYI